MLTQVIAGQLMAFHLFLFCPHFPLGYPLVFSSPVIQAEVVANYSLLFTWRGGLVE